MRSSKEATLSTKCYYIQLVHSVKCTSSGYFIL